MTTLPRNVEQVIAWSQHQRAIGATSWQGKCQAHCRSSYGVQAWSDSAIHAWGKIPLAHRHPGSDPSKAPRGALLYYSGGKYGHVALAIGNDGKNCLSNDWGGRGKIAVAPRTFRSPGHSWGIKYLGWSTWTPFGELALGK